MFQKRPDLWIAIVTAARVVIPAYLGMIGSQKKVKQVLDGLREEGAEEDWLKTIYAPIGLDIGSDTPSEIAVSIIAEMMQVLRDAKGGHLSDH